MVTGDNPKAYGQEIFLFGTRKGSGESVWDIKKNIGYFTPAMVDRFSRVMDEGPAAIILLDKDRRIEYINP